MVADLGAVVDEAPFARERSPGDPGGSAVVGGRALEGGRDGDGAADDAAHDLVGERLIAVALDGEGGGGGLEEGDDAGAAGQLFEEDGGIGELGALAAVRFGEGQGQVARPLEVFPEGLVGAAFAFELADAVEGHLVAEVVADGVAEESLGFAEGGVHVVLATGGGRGRVGQ